MAATVSAMNVLNTVKTVIVINVDIYVPVRQFIQETVTAVLFGELQEARVLVVFHVLINISPCWDINFVRFLKMISLFKFKKSQETWCKNSVQK